MLLATWRFRPKLRSAEPSRAGPLSAHSSANGTRLAGASRVGAVTYQPRSAEGAVLQRVVRENLETFLREAADRTDGEGLPRFIEREFREFLTCGALGLGRRVRVPARVLANFIEAGGRGWPGGWRKQHEPPRQWARACHDPARWVTGGDLRR